MRAYENGDYHSCAYKNGICGYCGPVAQDYRPCSKNSECESKFCDGRGHCRGKCKPRVKDGYKALKQGVNWDYNSCESTGHGHCGYCGYGNDVGMSCSENKDCKSGWCNGYGFEKVNCGGTCEAKRADGEKASNPDYNSNKYDYNSCIYGDGHCGYCGPTTEGGTCTGSSDCDDGLFCDDTEISIKGCTGTCKPIIDDNKECPFKTLKGNDSACKSGECMDFHHKVAYCRPKGGFLPPMSCTEDTDCSTAGHGYWCLDGGIGSIGQCDECPRKCENGCHAW